MMRFADKVYMLRNQANLSQAAFAEQLQVSRQTVSKWELGNSYPEIDKLIAISDLFHVSIDYLLKNQEPQESETNIDRLVLRFLGYAQDMEGISKELVTIMRDGIIDQTLNEVSQMIEEIKQGLHNNGFQ